MSVAFAGNSTAGSVARRRADPGDDRRRLRRRARPGLALDRREPGLEVAASLRTGREAVDQIERINPDVVVLDIEMPELDGISALPRLLAKKRDLVVIMASTLTRRNAEISLKALSLGAADYIPKPESNREASAADTFRRELIEKIRQLGARLRRKPAVASPPLAPASPAPAARAPLSRGPPRPHRPGRACAVVGSADHASVPTQARGAADRLLDRRSAGADGARRRARPA